MADHQEDHVQPPVSATAPPKSAPDHSNRQAQSPTGDSKTAADYDYTSKVDPDLAPYVARTASGSSVSSQARNTSGSPLSTSNTARSESPDAPTAAGAQGAHTEEPGEPGDALDSIKNVGNPRAKLNNQDIRLILYLIVTIKPFKYIGDRSMSQTKKWAMIQKRFSHLKQVSKSSHVFIPTVRTLQRQLSAAIRKAKERRNYVPINLDATTDPVFRSISEHSSLPELEMATLELFELSEALKNGKIANSALLEYSLVSQLEPTDSMADSFSSAVSSPVPTASEPVATVPVESGVSTPGEAPDEEEIVSKLEKVFGPSVDALNQLNGVRSQIRKVSAEGGDVYELIKELGRQSLELNKRTQQKVDRIIFTNSSLLQRNRVFVREQSELNGRLFEEVESYLRTRMSEEEVRSLKESLQ